jgi:hypothetical protein
LTLVTSAGMANLERQPGRTPRAVREQRAYRLAMTGGAAGVAAVVTGILAVIGILPFGIPVVAVIVAIVCALLFRRIVSPG